MGVGKRDWEKRAEKLGLVCKIKRKMLIKKERKKFLEKTSFFSKFS